MNTWMYGGELDGVYVPSIDHFFKLTDYTLGTILYCLLVLGGVGGTKVGKLKILIFLLSVN